LNTEQAEERERCSGRFGDHLLTILHCGVI
jgi:hypothetical protein